MIIDKTNPDHADLPDSLDGEVLLSIHTDSGGKVLGYHTATQEVVDRKRAMSMPDKISQGWDKHQAVLDALPAVLPKA